MAIATSSVTFPVSEPAGKLVHPVVRPPHLPFRRISLPTAPLLSNRESIVSVASFDSLPEEEPSINTPPSSLPSSPAKPRHRSKRKDPSTKPVNEVREAKRRKVIDEFYQTERAYVEGLELIYSHFLSPIIVSLETSRPLLDRTSLTSVFSNFIDIWNLHRSFLSALTGLVQTESASLNPPPLSPTLLSHFPYLSLYNPFVTAFPSLIATLNSLITHPAPGSTNPSYNSAFATFLATQEADPRCGKLKLRDWLLTIVQRCPRYLLLLKDLIDCTDPDDPEHVQLTSVHGLVSKITISLNTSLHAHAQTLALLAIQRSTPNLPFQLIVPGRSLIKRGPLLQIEQSNQPREREFLLFSDCLVWLASEDSEGVWSMVGWNSSGFVSAVALPPPPGRRSSLIRSRSKSEAELSNIRARDALKDEPPSPRPKTSAKSVYPQPASSGIKRNPSTNGDERWVYKGRIELVDLEVVVSPPREDGEERRFEILSPQGSFAVYAGGEEDRDDWASAIRQAKAQMMVSLNIMHPHSTLTSSTSTNHLRHSLQALPFHPSDERIATIRASGSSSSKTPKSKTKKAPLERRRKVEHWVPAIWIPDEKTEGCMRCNKPFGWRRRRHHCRLCGRCVCATCSERTFFISDPNSKEASKPARACNACYETVFPLLDLPRDEASELVGRNTDSVNTLSNVPLLLSLPTRPSTSTPHALMAIDTSPHKPARPDNHGHDIHSGDRKDRPERMRLRTSSRPRSYHQILSDFDRENAATRPLPQEELEPVHESSEPSTVRREDENVVDLTPSTPPLRPSRQEDSAKRHQRFSVPAVALQTTSVIAHSVAVPTVEGDETSSSHNATDSNGGGGRVGGAKSKRFSLVLGRSGSSHIQDPSGRRRQSEAHDEDSGRGEFGISVAVGKLSELLSRKKA